MPVRHNILRQFTISCSDYTQLLQEFVCLLAQPVRPLLNVSADPLTSLPLRDCKVSFVRVYVAFHPRSTLPVRTSRRHAMDCE
jgi:hypothetical protein